MEKSTLVALVDFMCWPTPPSRGGTFILFLLFFIYSGSVAFADAKTDFLTQPIFKKNFDEKKAAEREKKRREAIEAFEKIPLHPGVPKSAPTATSPLVNRGEKITSPGSVVLQSLPSSFPKVPTPQLMAGSSGAAMSPYCHHHPVYRGFCVYSSGRGWIICTELWGECRAENP